MRLRAYDSNIDFEVIKNWITDERTHSMWCAKLIGYPITREGFHGALCEMAGKFGDSPYVAVSEDGELVGFFCYSYNEETKEGMFKFVVTAPLNRGQGYGREMLSLAVKNAFETTDAKAVQLNVFCNNTKAKRCYESIGFEERRLFKNDYTFGEETWDKANMVITRHC